MSFFMPNKLNPQGQRLLTIIISLPVFVSTSYILYKRVALDNDVRRPMNRQAEEAATNDLFAQYEKDLEKEQQQQQQAQQSSAHSV